MKYVEENKKNFLRQVDDSNGYTLIEMIFVCSIVVLIAMMGMGSYKSQRKYGTEMRCVSGMKQIAQLQESFRDLGDFSLNPDGSYGTFFELRMRLIPKSYSAEDNLAHDGEPFLANYSIEIVKSPTGLTEEPDRNQYMVIATPVDPALKMRIFMMQEDGEVYFLRYNTSGDRMVWQ